VVERLVVVEIRFNNGLCFCHSSQLIIFCSRKGRLGQSSDLSDIIKGVFATAFTWRAKVTLLMFRETVLYFSADIKIGFFSGEHNDRKPFDDSLGTLAHTFSPTNGRFHLDADED